MLKHYSIKSRTARSGQAIVEMAFVITILLALSLGLIQFALLANARITLTNLARAGARYAAVHATEVNSDTAIKNYVVAAADSTPLNAIVANDVTISPAMGDTDRTNPHSITVSVSYNMRKKFILPVSFPGLGRFGNNTTSTAIMVIE